MSSLSNWITAIVFASTVICASLLSESTQFPIVDLGYRKQQALRYSSTGDFYTFSNIRYAQPPIGHLRWRKPVPPSGRSRKVFNGSETRVCHQGLPTWLLGALEASGGYFAGLPYNETEYQQALQQPIYPIEGFGAGATEDCLFLDVSVPAPILANASATCKAGGAPVIVWIHGGGYALSSKASSYDPTGLISASEVDGASGAIFVALNYRLGAFGFLASSQVQKNGILNAGLYDQRLALQWVQENIHLFGGDKTKVTVMGESAGAGSIMLQMTAFGGQGGPVPFAQGILQSLANAPQLSGEQAEDNYVVFLKSLNVTTLAQARRLPEEHLSAVNAIQIANAARPNFVWTPVVDNAFLPAQPSELLATGKFHKGIKVMIGHNLHEGLLFADPFVSNDTTYKQSLLNFLPGLPQEEVQHLTNVIYPPIFDGSYGYTNEFERAAITSEEGRITCNGLFVNNALGNKTYNYEFSISPGFHGQDVAYTFANGPLPGNGNRIATAMQRYFASFAMEQAPWGGPGFPTWNVVGKAGTMYNITGDGEGVVKKTANDIVASRCAYWAEVFSS